ncbi:MAG: TlpA disulfide reductase family protein [Myxococcota bacterium]
MNTVRWLLGLGLLTSCLGGRAPDFTLPKVSGSEVTLSEKGDDIVVLNFWFTSCAPCRAEIPALSAFARANPHVRLYGLSVDKLTPEQLGIASQRLGIHYPVLHDAYGRVARKYGVSAYPTTFVVRNMQIVDSHRGAIRRDQLEAMVQAAGQSSIAVEDPLSIGEDPFQGYGRVGDDGVYRRSHSPTARPKASGGFLMPFGLACLAGTAVFVVGAMVAYRVWQVPEDEAKEG